MSRLTTLTTALVLALTFGSVAQAQSGSGSQANDDVDCQCQILLRHKGTGGTDGNLEDMPRVEDEKMHSIVRELPESFGNDDLTDGNGGEEDKKLKKRFILSPLEKTQRFGDSSDREMNEVPATISCPRGGAFKLMPQGPQTVRIDLRGYENADRLEQAEELVLIEVEMNGISNLYPWTDGGIFDLPVLFPERMTVRLWTSEGVTVIDIEPTFTHDGAGVNKNA